MLAYCVELFKSPAVNFYHGWKKKKKKSLDLIVIHALISLQVKAHPSVAAHMLLDLEDVKKTSSTEPTLLLIDIAGYALHCCLCIVALYIKCCVL